MFFRHPFGDFFFFYFGCVSSLHQGYSFFFFPEKRHPTVLPHRLLGFKERLTPKNCELSWVNNAGVDWYSLQNQNPNFCIVQPYQQLRRRCFLLHQTFFLSRSFSRFFFSSLSLFFLSRFNFLRIQIMLPSCHNRMNVSTLNVRPFVMFLDSSTDC